MISIFSNATFHQDGFATVHNIDYLRDAKFVAAFESATTDIPENFRENFKSIIYRNHITTWAANLAAGLEGDFVDLACISEYKV